MKLKNTKIKKINIKSNEDVFDLTVNNNHNFFANNLLVHNCGEIPLPAYDSCRLLAINLYSYVENPFTKDATFNYELFAKHSKYAQRIMDDIVDLEIEKIDMILEKIDSDPEPEHIKDVERELWENMKQMAIDGRRTGIGITAEGDMVAAMGLTYGTKKATKISTEIHKQLAINVYKGSSILAKERGSFGIWDYEKEINNPFIKRLIEADPELGEMLKHGRRNIALLTIAPTGTSSLMTQTTSGIEPAFLVAYKRRRKINPNDKNVRVDFIDENNDSWEEYTVVHHKFQTWMEANGYDTIDMNKYSKSDLDKILNGNLSGFETKKLFHDFDLLFFGPVEIFHYWSR
jgi:ribonucleoside-diphosphate reductase alpha chain